jgi:hypothetical protein
MREEGNEEDTDSSVKLLVVAANGQRERLSCLHFLRALRLRGPSFRSNGFLLPMHQRRLFDRRCDVLRRTLRTELLLAIIAVLSQPRHVTAQGTGHWQVAVGAGGTTGKPLGHGYLFTGEIGRSFYTMSRLALDAQLTGTFFGASDHVCLASQQPCDERDLAGVGALGIAVTGTPFVSATTPYLRASAGPWMGQYSGSRPDQQSSDTGVVVAMEAGCRLRHFELGVAGRQFDGAIHGSVHTVSVVFRGRF